MPPSIIAFIDFASPYSYFALEPLAAMASQHGRKLELRPILLWAVLKEQGLANPLERDARRRYFMQDVFRSAAFFGRPFRAPEPLQFSAHLAARLFHARMQARPDQSLRLATDIYEALYVRGADITSPEVLSRLPVLAGDDAATVEDYLRGQTGRDLLADATREAVRSGVFGVPFVRLDDESFFGADRLPQIAWRLGQAAGGQAHGRPIPAGAT